MTTDENTMEPMLERTALARLLAQARTDSGRYRLENEGLIGEVKRLESQIRQWSRANMALVARLTKIEAALRECKAAQRVNEGTE